MLKKRVRLLDVNVDLIDQKQGISFIKDCFYTSGKHLVLFFFLYTLFRARRKKNYIKLLQSTDLIIPVSKAITNGIKFLKNEEKDLIIPFRFLLNAIHEAVEEKKSIYLYGSRKAVLEVAENNLKHSFPGIQIVGRCADYMGSKIEQDVVTAIKKAAPALVLVALQNRKENFWILRNIHQLPPAVYIGVNNFFEILADSKKMVPEKWQRAGLYGFYLFLRKPWRIWRIIPFLYYIFLLLIYKLFGWY